MSISYHMHIHCAHQQRALSRLPEGKEYGRLHESDLLAGVPKCPSTPQDKRQPKHLKVDDGCTISCRLTGVHLHAQLLQACYKLMILWLFIQVFKVH